MEENQTNNYELVQVQTNRYDNNLFVNQQVRFACFEFLKLIFHFILGYEQSGEQSK